MKNTKVKKLKGTSMKGKKNPDLHIVNLEKPVDTSIDEIIEENELLDELENKMRRRKFRFVRRIIIALGVLLLFLVGCYIFVTRQTYNNVHILNTYSNKADSGEQYIKFADGILKYSRDGVSFMNKKGKEQWNSSYQIKNPMISIREGSAAIADKLGNDISVFQKKGLKGEIHTNLPIQKIVVSAQGIVGAVLKDETTSKVICYDAAGNILVEHTTSAANTGYPMDIDISDNGYMLLVSYLLVEEGAVTSKVVYYNFGEEGQNKDNYVVREEEYKEVVIPTVFFQDNNTSVVVADNAMMIYKGKKIPEKVSTIPLENGIKSVVHNDKYIGIVSKDEAGNVVTMYNNNGRQVLSEKFEGEYKNIKIEGSQVIMYDGKKCNIFTKSGVHIFEGEFEADITDVFPLFGINKYLVISVNGLEEVRLAK